LTNTSLNLVHIATLDEIDPGMSIRMTAFSMLSLMAIPLIRYLAKRWMHETRCSERFEYLLIDSRLDLKRPT